MSPPLLQTDQTQPCEGFLWGHFILPAFLAAPRSRTIDGGMLSHKMCIRGRQEKLSPVTSSVEMLFSKSPDPILLRRISILGVDHSSPSLTSLISFLAQAEGECATE